MRIAKYKNENHLTNNLILSEEYNGMARDKRKLRANNAVERGLERLLSGSERLGWSYDDFVVHVLEVLVILRHRDQVRWDRPVHQRKKKADFNPNRGE
jgi:hypothetical protein